MLSSGKITSIKIYFSSLRAIIKAYKVGKLKNNKLYTKGYKNGKKINKTIKL